MYEPPHWTKPRQAPIAKRPNNDGITADTPAKPSTSPSIEDLAESIKTLKDGMRAMAEQLAGLTARVDDMAHPLLTPGLREPRVWPASPKLSYEQAKAEVEREDAALASIDTGPGGCANAIAEQERPYYAEIFEQVPKDARVGTVLRIRLPSDYKVIDGAGAALASEERVRLPNDFLTKMEEDAASGRVRTWTAARDKD